MQRHAPAKRTYETSRSPASHSFLTNKATKHYGIACSPIWDETIHKHEQKYWDSWEGVWRCKTINWIIKKVLGLPTPPHLMAHITKLTMDDRATIYESYEESHYPTTSNVVPTPRMMISSLGSAWSKARHLNRLQPPHIVRIPISKIFKIQSTHSFLKRQLMAHFQPR